MRERENKRKANLKKKAEREQKEREVRARMGIPEPVKGVYVGPSQIRLSGFLGERKREETRPEAEKREEKVFETLNRVKEEEKARAANRTSREPETSKPEKPKSQVTRSMNLPLLPMAPPKSRAPLQPRPANPTIYPKPPFFAQPPKPSIVNEDDWDSFFASNTQVEREIARPKTTAKLPITVITPARPCIAPVIDGTDTLDMISTQELDHAEEEAPVKPCVPNEEPRCNGYSKRGSESRDEARKEDGHKYKVRECKVEEQPGCKAETKQELTLEDEIYPESDYGDDADLFCESENMDINLIDFKNPQPFGLDEPDEELHFGGYLSDQEYEDDPLTVKLNSPTFLANYIANRTPTLPPPKTEDFDFDDIKDEEFEDLIADFETNSAQSPQNVDTPATEPFTASRDTPAPIEESFDYGEFELSTQEMRELGT